MGSFPEWNTSERTMKPSPERKHRSRSANAEDHTEGPRCVAPRPNFRADAGTEHASESAQEAALAEIQREDTWGRVPRFLRLASVPSPPHAPRFSSSILHPPPSTIPRTSPSITQDTRHTYRARVRPRRARAAAWKEAQWWSGGGVMLVLVVPKLPAKPGRQRAEWRMRATSTTLVGTGSAGKTSGKLSAKSREENDTRRSTCCPRVDVRAEPGRNLGGASATTWRRRQEDNVPVRALAPALRRPVAFAHGSRPPAPPPLHPSTSAQKYVHPARKSCAGAGGKPSADAGRKRIRGGSDTAGEGDTQRKVDAVATARVLICVVVLHLAHTRRDPGRVHPMHNPGVDAAWPPRLMSLRFRSRDVSGGGRTRRKADIHVTALGSSSSISARPHPPAPTPVREAAQTRPSLHHVPPPPAVSFPCSHPLTKHELSSPPRKLSSLLRISTSEERPRPLARSRRWWDGGRGGRRRDPSGSPALSRRRAGTGASTRRRAGRRHRPLHAHSTLHLRRVPPPRPDAMVSSPPPTTHARQKRARNISPTTAKVEVVRRGVRRAEARPVADRAEAPRFHDDAQEQEQDRDALHHEDEPRHDERRAPTALRGVGRSSVVLAEGHSAHFRRVAADAGVVHICVIAKMAKIGVEVAHGQGRGQGPGQARRSCTRMLVAVLVEPARAKTQQAVGGISGDIARIWRDREYCEDHGRPIDLSADDDEARVHAARTPYPVPRTHEDAAGGKFMTGEIARIAVGSSAGRRGGGRGRHDHRHARCSRYPCPRRTGQAARNPHLARSATTRGVGRVVNISQDRGVIVEIAKIPYSDRVDGKRRRRRGK
ncbi:hypothetical protein B0H11DRAFT_1912882 [Mycena galericulata]|nr:hypothetical protein B0H11DRAFT_1912882 [Mycena galericulata]